MPCTQTVSSCVFQSVKRSSKSVSSNWILSATVGGNSCVLEKQLSKNALNPSCFFLCLSSTFGTHKTWHTYICTQCDYRRKKCNWKNALHLQSVVLLLRSPIGTLIKDDTYIADCLFNSPAAWTAVFCLRGFHLVHAVFLHDHTTSCVAYPFTTYGYGIFKNMHTYSGVCHTHKGGQAQRVCTRVDAEGQENWP